MHIEFREAAAIAAASFAVLCIGKLRLAADCFFHLPLLRCPRLCYNI